ncbi:MAG: spherulation-specific family 4 protein [Caldilineaceae bacterium]
MMVIHKHKQPFLRLCSLFFVLSLFFTPASVVLANDDDGANTIFLPLVTSGATEVAVNQDVQAASVEPSKDMVQMLIPLYIFPLSAPDTLKPAWNDVIAANAKIPVTAIINPNSGPVKANHQNFAPYLYAMQQLKNAGVRMLGYVPTKTRWLNGQEVTLSILDVYNLIDRWHNLYRDDNGQPLIDGIFLDQAPSAYDIYDFDHYENFAGHVRALSADYQVVLNPGVSPNEVYINYPLVETYFPSTQTTVQPRTSRLADTTVIFENLSPYWPGYVPPTYVTDGTYDTIYAPPQQIYGAHRFSMMIHAVPDAATMRTYLDLARARNIGYVYVTDDATYTTDGNPWDTLPSYWQAEVDYIQQLNTLSFQASDIPTAFIRHQFFRAKLTSIFSDLDKKDATFKLVPGLANNGDPMRVSFESVNYPGYYLRVTATDNTVMLRVKQNDAQYLADATFRLRPGLNNASLTSFEAVSRPGAYLHHANGLVWVDPTNNSASFNPSATFNLTAPWWTTP